MRKSVFVILPLLFILLLTSCTPSKPVQPPGPDQELLESYVQLMKSYQYDKTYDLLPPDYQQYTSKEQFIELGKINKQVYKSVNYSFKIKPKNPNESYPTSYPIKYNRIVTYLLTRETVDLENNKNTDTHTAYVMSDGTKWIIAPGDDFKYELQYHYYVLGNYFESGLMVTKDFNKAAEYYLKSTQMGPLRFYIQYNAYFRLGEVYLQLKRYDDAIAVGNNILGQKNIQKFETAQAYCLIAKGYKGKGDLAKAKDAAKKALEFWPNKDPKSGDILQQNGLADLNL